MSANAGRKNYLVECFWPGVSERQLADATTRVELESRAHRSQGGHVDFLGSIFVPADETVFCLFAGDEQDVRTVSARAGVPFERVLESLQYDGRPMTDEHLGPDPAGKEQQ